MGLYRDRMVDAWEAARPAAAAVAPSPPCTPAPYDSCGGRLSGIGDCECDADSDLLVVEVRGMTPCGWWWWGWLWGPRALRRPSILRVLRAESACRIRISVADVTEALI